MVATVEAFKGEIGGEQGGEEQSVTVELANALPQYSDFGAVHNILEETSIDAVLTESVVPLLMAIERNTANTVASSRVQSHASSSLKGSNISQKSSSHASSLKENNIEQRSVSSWKEKEDIEYPTKTTDLAESKQPDEENESIANAIPVGKQSSQETAINIEETTTSTEGKTENGKQAVSASSEAVNAQRDKREHEKDRGALGDSLKKIFGEWDGSILQKNGVDDAGDAVGTASGGILWSAAKEIKDVADSSMSDDDNSLSSVIKKVVKEKTGVTAVQNRVAKVKEGAVGKVKKWATGESLPTGLKRDKNGRIRNEKGHYVSGAEENKKDENGVEDALAKNEKAEEKRHDELVKTVAAVASSVDGGKGIFSGGSGLFDGLLDGRRGRGGKALGKIGSAARGALTRVPGAAATIATGAGIGGVASVVGGGASAVGGGASAVGGGAGKLLGGSGKVLAGASKALKVLGPAASIITSGYDAYKGFNDDEMQREAFNLKDGETASLGQKTASAAANVLDMGGLLTGGLSMLGVESSTADIAKGVYSFFGGEDSATNATIDKPESKKVQSAQEVLEKSEETSKSKPVELSLTDMKTIKDGINKIVVAIEGGQGREGHKPGRLGRSGGAGFPMSTEFDDTTLVLLSHDRL